MLISAEHLCSCCLATPLAALPSSGDWLTSLLILSRLVTLSTESALALLFAERISFQRQSMSSVNQSIQNRIGQGWVTDIFVPSLNR